MPHDLYVQSGDRIYLHSDNWTACRDELCAYYPRPHDVFRADIELSRPAMHLRDVRVDRNPNGPWEGINGLGERVRSSIQYGDAHTWIYVCDDWSTVFGIHEVTHPDGTESYRFLVESCHQEPIAGERMILFASYQTIWPEPWGFNKPNIFAYFRGRFWFVSRIEWLMGYYWKGGTAYPIDHRWVDPWERWHTWTELARNHPDNRHPSEIRPPTFPKEPENEDIKAFINTILAAPADHLRYLVLCDWLEERYGTPAGLRLAAYMRAAFLRNELALDRQSISRAADRPGNYRSLEWMIVRGIENTHELWDRRGGARLPCGS